MDLWTTHRLAALCCVSLAAVLAWAAAAPAGQPRVLIPTARQGPSTWRYTTNAPPKGWQEPTFDDAAWPTGRAGLEAVGLGSRVNPSSIRFLSSARHSLVLHLSFTLSSAMLALLGRVEGASTDGVHLWSLCLRLAVKHKVPFLIVSRSGGVLSQVTGTINPRIDLYPEFHYTLAGPQRPVTRRTAP